MQITLRLAPIWELFHIAEILDVNNTNVKRDGRFLLHYSRQENDSKNNFNCTVKVINKTRDDVINNMKIWVFFLAPRASKNETCLKVKTARGNYAFCSGSKIITQSKELNATDYMNIEFEDKLANKLDFQFLIDGMYAHRNPIIT